MDTQPNFWGIVGRRSAPYGHEVQASLERSEPIWSSDSQKTSLYAAGQRLKAVSSWSSDPVRPTVFVFGSPYLSSDARFGAETSVVRLPVADAPNTIAELYEKHGTEAFARLDGDFAVILSDPQSKRVFLVVDKFGCDDIFIRQEDGQLLFASHPAYLLDGSAKFDPVSISFLLAQEGFIPSPFTLSPTIRTIGRARFLRADVSRNALRFAIEKYWTPSQSWKIDSRREGLSDFFGLMKDAVEIRLDQKSAVLLGGADSSLIANFAASRRDGEFIAITGAIKGYTTGELEIRRAKGLAQALKIPHEGVVLDPQDESLPEDWALCTNSFMSGARVALPLWLRYARHLRNRLGEGYTVLTGQLADTLADNNYTLPSPGYTLRRAFFSSWFLAAMPYLRRLSPKKDRFIARLLVGALRTSGRPRLAGMLLSLLDGMSDTQRFYEGRVFGYGEMPGRGAAYFPMLTVPGFDEVADWYSSNFIRPIVARLEPSNFYRQMIEMNLNMVMLHLDSRLLIQLYRLEGGTAQLPFMDTRVVNFFADLPYSSRAIYREPKHMIRAQLRRKDMVYEAGNGAPSPEAKSVEELLLLGSLGAHFRELLRDLTFVDRVPGLFKLVDERYLHDQLTSFRKAQQRTDYGFISKLAALEQWSRTTARANQVPQSCMTAR